MNNRSAGSINAELLLHYAGKVETVLWETGARINWVLMTQSIFSVVIIALARGSAGYSGELPLAGLKLAVSLPILLSAGSLATACLLMYQVGLVHHEKRLLDAILDIYASLGLEHWSLSPSIVHSLENPGVVTTVIALTLRDGVQGPAFWLSRMFVMTTFVGLPLFSQAVVAYELAQTRSPLWLIPVVVGLVMSVWHIFLYFRPIGPATKG
jgi:hypothetical protein